MGMAAGQARLLSITARLSDNEQKGQSLSFAKQRLADEADQVNREYNEALNATKLTVLTGFNGSEAQYTDISYSLLTDYNKLAGGKQYLVTDQRGRILVTQEIADAFEAGNGDFNVFINKFGLSQTDIDFKSTSISEDDKYQAIHDAWDKYLTSVGLGFPTVEHDEENPEVNFCWNSVSDTFAFPYVNIPPVLKQSEKKIFTGSFNNNGQIASLANGPYSIAQGIDAYGNPASIQNDAGQTVNVFYFSAKDQDDQDQLFRIYQADRNSYHVYRYDPEGLNANQFGWVQYDDIPVGNVSLTWYGPRITYCCTDCLPLNFEGTTKEQRELYEYAVALTRSAAGADDFDGDNIPDVKTIADNPENLSEVQYYRNIFNEMQQFGYVTEDGLHIHQSPSTQRENVVKTGIKDNNWFEQCIRQGKLLLKTYDPVQGEFVTTTFAEDSNIQEVEDDRKIAKAELDYNQAQEALERKDKKIDLSLKQLDTEHNALQTEYESVKSVVDKNIEKSFNIFS